MKHLALLALGDLAVGIMSPSERPRFEKKPKNTCCTWHLGRLHCLANCIPRSFALQSSDMAAWHSAPQSYHAQKVTSQNQLFLVCLFNICTTARQLGANCLVRKTHQKLSKHLASNLCTHLIFIYSYSIIYTRVPTGICRQGSLVCCSTSSPLYNYSQSAKTSASTPNSGTYHTSLDPPDCLQLNMDVHERPMTTMNSP